MKRDRMMVKPSEQTAPAARRRAAGALAAEARAVPPRSERPSKLGPAILIAVGGLLIVGALVLPGRTPDSRMADAVAAFRAGRLEAAEADLRGVLAERDDEDATARLYLARILRRDGRPAEAASLLRDAAARAPRDADIRRELGYLFLDLDRPRAAAEQFERAIEFEPAEPMGWVGAVRALRAAADPRADTVLRRAPAEVRALLER